MSNETVIKVKVDESGTVQYFDKLGNAMDGAEKSATAASGGFSKTQASLVALQAGVALTAQAFTFAADNIGKVFQVISAGSAVDDTTAAFNELAQSAGVAGDTLLSNLNTALADTIPNVQLMQQANELLIGGLNPDQIELVANAARTLGEYTGTDAAQGMNALSDSLLKGNDRALKTLGIVVDNNKALKDFADAQGIAVDLLSETAKVEAIREASLRSLAEQQDKLTKATVDGGDRVSQVNKILVDTFNKVQQAVAGDAGVNQALDDLIATMKGIDFDAVANGFITIANGIIQVANASANAIQWLSKLVNNQSSLDMAFGASTKQSKAFNSQMVQVIKTLEGDTPEALDLARSKFREVKAAMDEAAKAGKFTVQEFNFLEAELNKTATAVQDVMRANGLLADETLKVIPPIQKVKTGLIDVVAEARKAEQASKDLAKQGLEKVSEAAIDAAFELESLRLTAQELGQNPIDILFESQNLGGGDTASLTNSKGFQIGMMLAEGISRGLDEGFTRQGGVDLLGSIGKGLAPEYGPLIDVGTNLLGKAVEHIFGGEHAGTTARKAADKFFADAFDADRLFVIIDGQLKQIEDLVFKGETLFGGNSDFNDGSFDNFFAGLPEAAQAAFAGVGLGFEELLGVGSDISGQIGAVLANNIGGSLNNLQLLVQSSGKSFEELRGSVVEAFLDGKVSALEAQTALNGLAQVAQDGIPDAIGATVQAFANMQAAGAKGGRALIDAFKDIGFEAKELGIKDFGALAANIIASGKYSTETVNAYFDELRRQGIDNVEELANASNEQLISIGSALQASGFLEEAANSTAELIETINDLPNEKTLTFNIKTNFDANTQAAQDQGYVPRLSTAGGSISY